MIFKAIQKDDRNLRRRYSGSMSKLIESRAPFSSWMPFKVDECLLPSIASGVPILGRIKQKPIHTFREQAIRDIAFRTLLCWILSFPGLIVRFRFASSPFVFVRDTLSVTCENHFLLAAWHWLWIENRHKGKVRILQWLFVLFMTSFWVAAGWGDLVFETQTHGIIPRVEIIASGLADPSVHLAVQVSNSYQKNIFWGALFKILFSLLLALALQQYYVHRARIKRSSMNCYDQTRSRNCSELSFVSFFMTSRMSLSGHLASLIFMYLVCGSWAPATNFATAWTMSLCWRVPVISTSVIKQPKHVLLESESMFQKQEHTTFDKVQKPNVIIVVHESLSGAALETTSGRDAAPWFHSTKSHDDFYHFSAARAPAGTTTIATPAILSGLMPYSKDCVDVMKRSSLTEDFKLLGYETGSFVSYGARWPPGTSWSLLTEFLSSKFDTVVDPQSTGEKKVNEYGMDDRKIVEYFNNWLLLRSNSTNTTGSTTLPRKNTTFLSPFFATMVFNNQHFPHLEHAKYSAPGCGESTMSEEGFSVDDFSKGREGGEYSVDEEYNAAFDDIVPDFSYVDYPVCRYYSSLRTMDESLKALFDGLNATGVLNNTIVIGAGDHGETPGITKRLKDVDAPIYHVPLWMHIPAQLLTARALRENQMAGNHRTRIMSIQKGGKTMNETLSQCFRKNVNKSVSTLDIVPTLRDVLNFPRLYTTKQQKECVTGKSLLNKAIEEDRLVIGWGGTPLDGMNNGMFATKTQALLFYPRDISRSRVIDFTYDEKDPFFKLYERRFQEMKLEELLSWRSAIERQGWMSSNFVKSVMPGLDSESVWHTNRSSNIN